MASIRPGMDSHNGVRMTSIFVYVLRFEENFVGTIEAADADEALALAFQRAMKTRRLPLHEAIAFPVEIVGDDKSAPELRPVSIVSVRGMLLALRDYQEAMILPEREDRDAARQELIRWFTGVNNVKISFAGEKDFEDARE